MLPICWVNAWRKPSPSDKKITIEPTATAMPRAVKKVRSGRKRSELKASGQTTLREVGAADHFAARAHRS